MKKQLSLHLKRQGQMLLCESDDYWVDPLKLQKQSLKWKNTRMYIGFTLQFKDGLMEAEKIEFTSYILINYDLSTEKVIMGGGGFMHTGSVVINRLAISRIMFLISPKKLLGIIICRYWGQNGGALYLSDIMVF